MDIAELVILLFILIGLFCFILDKYLSSKDNFEVDKCEKALDRQRRRQSIKRIK